MKLNISYPRFRAQKLLEIDDERKVRFFYDKRISDQVPADSLGEEWTGYVFQITGGHDKQGFAMMQGVGKNHRVRLLLNGKGSHYNNRRVGDKRRKSVRGCIVGADLSVIALRIVKKGPADIPGLTDPASDKPSARGPKRANNIRKAYGLDKSESVIPFVVKRTIPGKDGKPATTKSPKIQRLITPATLQRKKRKLALKKRRFTAATAAKAEYAKVVAQVRIEKRAALLSKKERASVKA
eukprot:TRINITY_DN10468_c1_g1_i1.p2 TRINITY_DN10468_c1_g1~~TRINITY_DN10468_c1_g1_i1.p2  ORF type:complete len:239 (+),score=78.85 TRINITY_DN10468_c1_g1_i1:50-766(+)